MPAGDLLVPGAAHPNAKAGWGTAVPWGAGGTHKRVLWDVQKRHPEPYVHGEGRDVLGAVRTQKGKITGQERAPFQRLLFWLSADAASPGRGVPALGEAGITPSRTPRLQGLSVAVFSPLSAGLAMVCPLMEGVTVAATYSLSPRCLH